MSQTSAVIHDTDFFIHCLTQMRDYGGAATTTGVPEHTLLAFLPQDPALRTAIERAYAAFEGLQASHKDLLQLDEISQTTRVQDGYLNFYAQDQVNPYVALAAQGPWIVTLKGAVIYDCGGYGMLGLGHAPPAILAAMNQSQVMANVMTPAISQMTLVDSLRKEIGHTRSDADPFARFLCLNSGSEAVSIGSRISDINAREMTDPGGRHAGKPIRSASLRGSFHGRTDRPARYSDSSMKNYRRYLASFRDMDELLTIEPNNIESLEAAFAQAEQQGFFIEAFFMEPVMGEGNPGLSITPQFYQRARELTAEHGSMFLVDSIQAGLRARGVLSITDYPGFQELAPPDMEVYSKSLNAGQFPLSVLAMSAATAALYHQGLYGNTMTTNPRATDVACAVLDSFTPQIRENIVQRGAQLVEGLRSLAKELDGAITAVQGTGLLLSCELDTRFKCSGANSTEEYLRKNGLGVIHGGVNSLRYTPGFLINEAEVELILERTRDALLNGPCETPPA
jgi:acetylornithine/succinyldiaminopimelate/putrescine aminotransferase